MSQEDNNDSSWDDVDEEDEMYNDMLEEAFKLEDEEEKQSEKLAEPQQQYSSDLGCPHYPHNCQIEAPCCLEFYWCRVCHNEQAYERCKCKVEDMDRYSVKRLKCMRCNMIQSADNVECEQCKTKFGEFYTCTICHLYSNDPKKLIFHCDECKICRIGKRENFVHCLTCPVCLENIFNSREQVMLLNCGHPIHQMCYRESLKNHLYTCPLCQKYMIEVTDEDNQMIDQEIANTPMPEEFRDKKVHILCNQCCQKSETNFHILGLKCSHCGSYNTKQIV